MAVGTRGEKIVIDFRCYLPDRRRVRCVEIEGVITKENQKRARLKWKAIQYALKHDTFDYLQFFPHGSKVKYFQEADLKAQRRSSTQTFSEWWDRWLNLVTLRMPTATNYKYHYERHIKPYFGHIPLGDITDEDVLLFRKLLEGEGYKASTINLYIKILCQPLLAAYKKKIIDTHPCEMLRKLSEPGSDIDPFSFSELKHLLDALKEKEPAWHDLILFWSRTGLRPGELYALRWQHIDFFNKKALIRESKQQIGGKAGPPKNKNSIRDVDLRPQVIDALKRHRSRTGLLDKWVFMFHGRVQFNSHSMRSEISRILRLHGVKRRPPRHIRHTFATLHIAAGESITWVSRMLGHADVTITLKRYNRFVPNLTRDDGSAFERVYEAENGKNLVTTEKSTK
jgi:integrase